MHKIVTLKDFYALMADTAKLRAQLVQSLILGKAIDTADIMYLETAHATLESIRQEQGEYILELSPGVTVPVNLKYELTELYKDIFFLKNGEQAFKQYLASMHHGFLEEVEKVAAALAGRQYTTWITDRDGTTNNYCGRYNSSVQSVYNAFWLSRFAQKRTKHAVFITSAPLSNFGIVDVSVNPQGVFVYAGSKGREFIDTQGKHYSYAIDPLKQNVLEEFNSRLEQELAQPRQEKFCLIGSGYQRKFGQTTIARQDITRSIPEADSLAFLHTIQSIVEELDPKKENFVIEDTGLDVEIILTVEGQGNKSKDFDKEEGVYFLNEQLNLDMDSGCTLISGDTRSDLPLVRAGIRGNGETWSLFVTQDAELASEVQALCPNTVIASCPDVFVAALACLANESLP